MIVRVPGEGSRRPGLALFCIALVAGCGIAFDNFLSPDNVDAIALDSATVLIVAVGAMCLLISGNIDLSIGSMYALVGVVVAQVNVATSSTVLSVLAGIAVGALLGTVNGVLVETLRISSLIVTLAMLAAYRGLAHVFADGQAVLGLSADFVDFGQAQVLGIPMAAFVALAAFGLGTWLLAATVQGLRTYAVGGDRHAAEQLGVRPRSLVIRTFALNGALVGVAAVLTTATLASALPSVGVQLELDVLTAVVLGGVAFTGGHGHPLGVLVGVVTIAVLDAGLIFAGLEDWYQQVARGGMLLLALTADQLVLRHQARRRAVVPRQADADEPVRIGEGPPSEECDVDVRGLAVRFTTTDALEDVDVAFHGGQVLCLVGDNGAGKSTLVRAVAGLEERAEGTIALAGRQLPKDPRKARALGVETVFQRPAMCTNLSGLDNLVLGLEPRRRLLGVLPVRDLAAAEQVAVDRFAALGLAPRDVHRPVARLSGGERQLLAIMRAVRPGARVVLLDEPTASLGVSQAGRVLALARAIAASGRAVVMVTHDVEEVFEVADRVVVLRHGQVIHDGPIGRLTRLELLGLMSGRARREATRTMAAVTAERLRIERDLHDGAQQELVNAALMVRMASDALGKQADPRLAGLLTSSSETIRLALRELRDLARGIYPAMLQERGIGAALEALAMRTTLPLELEIDVPRLPADVELAAYFVTAEAVTNAQKHAGASHVAIQARVVGKRLDLEIRDDGNGAVDEAGGSGLAGLRARVAALDGHFEVTGAAGEGTRLSVQIPV